MSSEVDKKNGEDSIIERESADGHTYTSRSVPCEVTLEVIDHKNHESLRDTGAFETHHIYVSCEEVANEYLPFLDANPREPSVTSQVRNMQQTLQKNPVDFVKKNNGLSIICDNIETDEERGKITIEFSENEGICNGGHTYFAIQTLDAPLEESASVRIEAIQIADELTGEERRDQIRGIARARNDNQSLHTSSEADYVGYYDAYKYGMRNTNSVTWHEGDADACEDAISAVHFIRLLYSLDWNSYYHPLYNLGGDRHKRLVTSPGNIHSNWFDQMEDAMRGVNVIPMLYMIPLIDDMFGIRDHLSHFLKEAGLSGEVGGDSVVIRRTSFYKEYVSSSTTRHLRYTDEEEGFNLSNTLETILMGLFRSNVWRCRDQEGEVGMVGWFIEPTELWNRRQLSVLSQMSEYFQEVDSDPWQFQRQASPYEKDLYQFGWEALEGEESPPNPSVVYEIDELSTHTNIETKFERYVKVENQNEASHWYSDEGGCNLHLLENSTPDLDADFALYRHAER